MSWSHDDSRAASLFEQVLEHRGVDRIGPGTARRRSTVRRVDDRSDQLRLLVHAAR
jgi:hypothetical protein